jgi:hypothetical protein
MRSHRWIARADRMIREQIDIDDRLSEGGHYHPDYKIRYLVS